MFCPIFHMQGSNILSFRDFKTKNVGSEIFEYMVQIVCRASTQHIIDKNIVLMLRAGIRVFPKFDIPCETCCGMESLRCFWPLPSPPFNAKFPRQASLARVANLSHAHALGRASIRGAPASRDANCTSRNAVLNCPRRQCFPWIEAGLGSVTSPFVPMLLETRPTHTPAASAFLWTHEQLSLASNHY